MLDPLKSTSVLTEVTVVLSVTSPVPSKFTAVAVTPPVIENALAVESLTAEFAAPPADVEPA